MKFSSYFTNFKQFFKYGWKFRKFRTWDFSYTLAGWSVLLEEMSKDFETIAKSDHCHVGIEKDIKNLKIAAILCKRLSKDDYYTIYSQRANKQIDEWYESGIETKLPDGSILMEFPEKKGTDWVRLEMKVQKAQRQDDLDLLAKLLRTKLTKIWY